MLSEDIGPAIRQILRDKGCPICGEKAWDFRGARIVFSLATGSTRNARTVLGVAGVRDASPGRITMKVLEEAERKNRLVEIVCENCAHTAFFNANMLRERGRQLSPRR